MSRPNRHIVKVSEHLAEARAIAVSQDWQRLGASLDEAQAALLHVGSEKPATKSLANFAPVNIKLKLRRASSLRESAPDQPTVSSRKR
jgi:hypothetical protein